MLQRLLRVAFQLLIIFSAGSAAVQAQDNAKQANNSSTSWNPKHTWVFSVATLDWQDKNQPKCGQSHRRDGSILQAFRAHGVPESHIISLKDKDATLSVIQGRLVKLLEQTQADDTLFFYYCGRGTTDKNGNGYFSNYDATSDPQNCWSTDSLAEDLQGFKGNNAIFAIDCPQAVTLVAALKKSKPAYNFALLAPANVAQDTNYNWTFSQTLLDCLQGHVFADANNDNATTFGEFAGYVKQEIKELDKADTIQAASAGFDPAFRLGTTTFINEPLPQKVEALHDRDWHSAKLLETIGSQGKIRWLAIGWEAPDDDEWLDLNEIRRPGATTTLGAELGNTDTVLSKAK